MGFVAIGAMKAGILNLYHYLRTHPERLASFVPSAHLIYELRKPAERMRPNELHQLAAGKKTRPTEFLGRPSSEEARILAYMMGSDDPLSDPEDRKSLAVRLRIREVLRHVGGRRLAIIGLRRRSSR